MQEWAKIVTNPLGLAGFALFLVFQTLSWSAKNKKRGRLGAQFAVRFALFFLMSLIALVGGIWLAHEDRSTQHQLQNPIVHSIAKPSAGSTRPVTQSATKSQDVIQVGNAKDVTISTAALPKGGKQKVAPPVQREQK